MERSARGRKEKAMIERAAPKSKDKCGTIYASMAMEQAIAEQQRPAPYPHKTRGGKGVVGQAISRAHAKRKAARHD